MALETKIIPVGQLMLDVRNPRHEKVRSQKDAIRALIEVERAKLVVLAKDVLKYGLSPIDRLLVLRSDRNYIVLEGNRRLAVVKILANPSLAEGTSIEGPMKRLAAKGPIPTEADCAIATSRKSAKHWMELRHGGEADGAGVVPWSTLASNRFGGNPGREAAAAIRFLEQVERAYPKNDVMQALVRDVANNKLTTVGRLVLDPNFQQRAGMVTSDGSLTFEFPAAALEDFFEQVLTDLATTVGISSLRKKPERAEYLEGTPQPDPSKRKRTASALTESRNKKPKPKAKRAKRPSKPPKPFAGLELANLGERIENILREFQGIDVDLRPNAAALLTRAILELSVDQYIAKKSLSTEGKLKKRLQRTLNKVDPTQKDGKFQGIRQGLSDGTSLFAVGTLHGYVHNPHYHPVGSEVRAIAANLTPFLEALNDDI
jgi:hypothetical protein